MGVVIGSDSFNLFCFQGQGFPKVGNDPNIGNVVAKWKKEKVGSGYLSNWLSQLFLLLSGIQKKNI